MNPILITGLALIPDARLDRTYPIKFSDSSEWDEPSADSFGAAEQAPADDVVLVFAQLAATKLSAANAASTTNSLLLILTSLP